MIFGPKTLQNSKFFNQLNVFPMSPVFVTTPFLVQKALKTANSEKFVFSCQTSKVVPEPPSSLVFRRKPASRVCRAPNSVFCPEKPANSSPLNPSPLVTALSPLAFWVQKCTKPGPVPKLLRPGSMSDSPPRWSVSPPSLSPLMSPLHPALGPKSAQKKKARETSSAASMGLQILVDPASSHMLVSKPFLKRSRARFLPGPPLITLRVNNGTGEQRPLVTQEVALDRGSQHVRAGHHHELVQARVAGYHGCQATCQVYKLGKGKLHDVVKLMANCLEQKGTMRAMSRGEYDGLVAANEPSPEFSPRRVLKNYGDMTTSEFQSHLIKLDTTFRGDKALNTGKRPPNTEDEFVHLQSRALMQLRKQLQDDQLQTESLLVSRHRQLLMTDFVINESTVNCWWYNPEVHQKQPLDFFEAYGRARDERRTLIFYRDSGKSWVDAGGWGSSFMVGLWKKTHKFAPLSGRSTTWWPTSGG